MQIKLLIVLMALCAGAACAPEKKCSGELVLDEATESCAPCPKNAKFKDGTCECPSGYDYVGFLCKQNADAMAMGSEDAGATSDGGAGDASVANNAASCEDYCTFMNYCIGMNSLAGALGTVASDLHADDVGACKSSCEADVGSDGSSAALACMSAQKANEMCADPNPQNGLTAAFGVIGMCCGPRPTDPLCKSICKPLKASPIFSSRAEFCP